MSTNHLPPGTKECKSCEAPVPVDGPAHISAGDCRSAQRKYIRELRSTNDKLRGELDEAGKMRDAGAQLRIKEALAPPRAQFAGRSRDAYDYARAVGEGTCACRLIWKSEDMGLRGRPCPKHG